jgi:3-hydroxybutyrate dehydrogenase
MLQGKTALVTGSTSGIGLGMALALGKQGAKVMLNGFGDVEGALAQVRATGAEVAYHGADMSKPAEIEAMMRECSARLGGPDILVNNAGIQHVANVEDFPLERWDAIIAINLSSAFHTMRMALPAMKQRGWGRVINVASAHGLVASAGKSAYVAAKHGIVGLTKASALECATSGVTVNAICPGWVLTPLVQGFRGRGRAPAARREAALAALHDARAAGRAGGVPLQPGGRQRARRGLGDGRRLDRAVSLSAASAARCR